MKRNPNRKYKKEEIKAEAEWKRREWKSNWGKDNEKTKRRKTCKRTYEYKEEGGNQIMKDQERKEYSKWIRKWTEDEGMQTKSW